ncbi:MAG: ABC transporter ATP-binding protein [Clostridia bacterium]|nr:ABC transporter ATP-binding protein [Clostridia bacterium]
MSIEQSEKIIECENLVKIYKTRDAEVMALQGLDLEVYKGEMMGIIGNSGSGKSTLMNMLGGLDKPSAGKLYVDGKDLLKYSEKQLDQYRRETVGFVWQNNARNLIPYLTAADNIEIPMMLDGKIKRRQRVSELLELVGLPHRKDSMLFQLSGGEQQRVAIAIALANSPGLLLADEPTGAVDTKTMRQIMDLFNGLVREMGITIVIVTHDRQLSRMVDRVVAIRDGRTSSEFIRKKTYSEELSEIEGDSLVNTETHEELTVIDKAGRLQIPKEFIDDLDIGRSGKVRIMKEDNRIIIMEP